MKFYITITISHVKDPLFFIKLELRPVESKTKFYEIYLRKLDVDEFILFDPKRKLLEQIDHGLLSLISFVRSFLYKSPGFYINNEVFHHN